MGAHALGATTALGRFDLIRRLGEGGMGIVYEAKDRERGGAHVAIKTLHEQSPEALARFKREFRALQDVQHPSLVSLGELSSDGDRLFFTMELVEGADFLAYVRDGSRDEPGVDRALADTARSHARPAFDDGRLRDALRQIAGALHAMHDAGLVHRDVKPSNVRVTKEGRAVLLDFGLVTEVRPRSDPSTMAVVGTVAYMAPEQAASTVVGPEADWYAFGVMLYEALTGEVPFDGAPLEVLLRKQRDDAPLASALVHDVPPDLDALCERLLRFDPAKRADGRAVLRALGSRPATTTGLRSAPSSQTQQTLLVGRDGELAALHAAFEDSAHEAVTVVVSGESGIGKSCLVKRFVESVALTDHAVVLSGRCYERDAVPYKAFDGIVDSLVRHLTHASRVESAAVLPTRPGSLLRVFPILGRVTGVAPTRPENEAIEPHELRRRAFAGMRDLLTRLALRHRVVLVVDDAHWADADSLALFAEVLREPSAPPLLVIAAVRAGTEAISAIAADARAITLGRFGADDARKLAEVAIARSTRESARDAGAIAREGDGHPLFIDALVRFGAHGGSLEDALWAGIAELDPLSRAVLEILSVAEIPIAEASVAHALAADRAALARSIASLRVANFLTTSGARDATALEPYHGRVRGAVLAHLDEEEARARHRAIALALEAAGGTDAQALARHWRGCGDRDRAAGYMLKAADEAATALAFDRAARMYEEGLALRDPTDADRRAIERKRGEALANAGRGELAARAYAEASRGANASDALEMRLRSAEQLLKCGHFDEGLAASRVVLGMVGMRFPSSPLMAILEVILGRAILWLRGTRFKERDVSELSPLTITRIDVCWAVGLTTISADPSRGSAIQTRQLLLALRAGDPSRVARALCAEAAYTVLMGGIAQVPRAERLLARCRELYERVGSPYLKAGMWASEAMTLYLTGRFRECLDLADRAERLFRDACLGATWELTSVQAMALWSLANLGQIADLERRQSVYARDATDRGDLYGLVSYCTADMALIWLAKDDPARVHTQVDGAMARWSRNYGIEHFYELLARVHADLYMGEAKRAHERTTREWPFLRRTLLLRIESVRAQSLYVRARAVLGAHEVGAIGAPGLRLAARIGRDLGRERLPFAAAESSLVRAAVAGRTGHVSEAVALARRGIDALDALEMRLYATAGRRRLGAAIGGDEGAALVARADDELRAMGVAVPERMAHALVPALVMPRG